MKNSVKWLVLHWVLLLAINLPAANVVSLKGEWRFALDRHDTGISERWFKQALTGKIALPGSLPGQGIGDPVTTNTVWTGGIVDRSWFAAPEYAPYRQSGNVKVPFWLQPDTYYAGAAWFQRDITIPPAWSGERILLSLERPHWETRVWVDSNCLGTNNSLSTTHEYDLGRLTPGRHTLTIRVDNRRIVDIGENSHSISDHTQGNWNGLVGDLHLSATPPVWLADLQVYPHLAGRSVTVTGQIGNVTGTNGAGEIQFSMGRQAAGTLAVTWTTNGGTFTHEIPLGEKVPLWDEFHPALLQLTVRLDNHERRVSFGLREIATEDTQFTINSQKTFLRGTLECCIFPRTGHPPTDVAAWKRIIRVAKAHGLNLIRFHSWCPPEAAFVAADELGFYYQVEIASWANQSTTLGAGQPVDAWLYAEAERILRAYGNHPSFVLMPYGNEPAGKESNAWLARWVTHWQSRDPRRLYTSASGWPQLPQNQFHITPDPRIQAWGDGLKSRINARPPETTTDYRHYLAQRTVPVISHEIGQWCVYPNFDEIKKYTGYLHPKNFEIFHDRLAASGLDGLARQFLLASGKLQLLCYKEDIESALRSPGMGGFELLDLHDFPGQGTALVGVLDPFWDDKGYVTAPEYRRFCNQTVPLARLAKRVFTVTENLVARVEIAHFGPQPMHGVTPVWKLVNDQGRTLAAGTLATQDIPIGNGTPLGSLNVALQNFPAPARYKLVVGLPGTEFNNDWDIWVYPALATPAAPPGLLVTDSFDATARNVLHAGGKVLLTLPGRSVRNFDHDPVQLGFSSIFWNTAWTGRQAPTTLGIVCDPRQPALAEFPTDEYSNWQWWYLVHRAGALRLDLLPRDLKPMVRVIDDWVTARPLGLVVEGRVGAGKIIICGFDLTREAGDPVSQQMRRSLADYAASDHFAPATELTEAAVTALSQN